MFLLAHYSPAKGCFSSRLWQLEENVRRQNKKPFLLMAEIRRGILLGVSVRFDTTG
ncbi:MAG: hypothetical protein OXC17_06410 [Aestuariivita sp.]|nr:hypothetical protein [Aestuariivita sp.]